MTARRRESTVSGRDALLILRIAFIAARTTTQRQQLEVEIVALERSLRARRVRFGKAWSRRFPELHGAAS